MFRNPHLGEGSRNRAGAKLQARGHDEAQDLAQISQHSELSLVSEHSVPRHGHLSLRPS